MYICIHIYTQENKKTSGLGRLALPDAGLLGSPATSRSMLNHINTDGSSSNNNSNINDDHVNNNNK